MPEVSKITGEISISKEVFSDLQNKIKGVPDFKKQFDSSLEKEASDILNVLFAGALALSASDIHIETQEKNAKLRLRADGMLQDAAEIDLKIYSTLLSRIKLLSGIKLNVLDRPQDGRFSVLSASGAVEIRASTLPSEYGESIALRILNPKSIISMEELGLRPDLLDLFKKEIKRPNGMILVTGPTGSGKTTTLYAFLKMVQNPEIKIITIEDPIEYHLEGISQTQIDKQKGYDFASGLKSIMRQDPDVILVGEIRDLETAQIALQAALTGHLVFSTIHTNDAAGAVARIQSLGEKPVNIAPALNLSIAQRLVRKICPECKKMEKPSLAVLEKIKKGLKKTPPTVKIPKIDGKLKIAEATGCKNCNFTGYRGRVGIYEAFLIDDEMENFILKSPSIADMKEKAIKKGMATLYQDGLIKVLQGATSLEEVERVAQE